MYLGLALIAIAIAGALGWRIGRAFATTWRLAERELEAAGVADVLRGGRIRGDARFQSVAALMNATDKLGGVFREFASAQQRAIDARDGDRADARAVSRVDEPRPQGPAQRDPGLRGARVARER